MMQGGFGLYNAFKLKRIAGSMGGAGSAAGGETGAAYSALGGTGEMAGTTAAAGAAATALTVLAAAAGAAVASFGVIKEVGKDISKFTSSKGIWGKVGAIGPDILSAIQGPGGALNIAAKGLGIGKSTGGVIPGQDMGHDSVLAALRPQEGVLVPGATRALGGERGIEAINRQYGGGGKNLRGHYAQGGVTGTEVANYAKSLSMPGNKNLYTWDGGAMGAWDCSGFSANVYEKYGFFPGGQGQRHGTSESQYSDPLLKSAPDQPGALVFFDTHDGQTPPSHVGVSLGGGKYAGADGPQGAPNAINSSSGAMGFRIPNKGFSSSGGAVGASVTGNGTKTSDKTTTTTTSSGGVGGGGGSSSGLSEADNVAGALGGSASGSSGSTTTTTTKTATSPSNGGGGSNGGSPALTAGVGNVPANAKSIAAYLMGKGANKIATAGILGNIMQESGGSPTAGSNPPGAGLIQILGDPGGSLESELIKTWAYIQQNGGIGPVNKATSPTQAATIFSQQYERPRTPMLNNRIASAVASYKAGYSGGTSGATPGWHAVGEHGMEMVNMRGGEQVLNHAASMASSHSGRGYASGVGGGNLTFGDIHITCTGAITDPGAASKSAQEMVRQVKVQLERADVLDQIASGVTH
jgi:hypothetical protein